MTGKGPSVTSITSATPIVSDVKTARTVSPTTSIEEIPTPSKRPHLTVKEKEKADSRSSTIWDDKGLVVERAYRVVTVEDLKAFSGVPFNMVVNQHVHKLVQIKCSCIYQFLFSSLIVLTASIFFSGVKGESPSCF